MPAPSSPDLKTVPPPASVAVDDIHYRQLFPWLRMFDLFWIAVDLQKLITAAVAVVLLWGGNWCIRQLPFATEEAISPQPAPFTFAASRESTAGPWTQADDFRAPLNDRDWRSWSRVFTPLDAVVLPAQMLFRHGTTWPQLAMAWSYLLWALIVWSIFGGAITRIAAVQIGSDHKTTVWEALRFSGTRFLSYFSAPLIPLAGIGLLWGVYLLGGLVGRIPHAGSWIVGAFWIVALLFGFLMGLLLVGLAAGWPLMLATISVEGSDAADGLTRSYGYVFNRPIYFTALVLFTAISGAVATFFVARLADFAGYLALLGVTSSMGSNAIAENPFTLFWMGMWATIVVAFAQSFFWSAATMIYYLLRRSIDANPFSEVYLEEDRRDDLLPWIAEDESADESPAAANGIPTTPGPAADTPDPNMDAAT